MFVSHLDVKQRNFVVVPSEHEILLQIFSEQRENTCEKPILNVGAKDTGICTKHSSWGSLVPPSLPERIRRRRDGSVTLDASCAGTQSLGAASSCDASISSFRPKYQVRRDGNGTRLELHR